MMAVYKAEVHTTHACINNKKESLSWPQEKKKKEDMEEWRANEKKEIIKKKDAPSCVETDRTATSLFASISIPWFVENFVSFVARSDSEEFLARWNTLDERFLIIWALKSVWLIKELTT